MTPSSVNYALYLVTDSTPAVLGDKDLVSVVKAAVEGGSIDFQLVSHTYKTSYSFVAGVTVVQLRDKTSDTAELIQIARELHKVTKAGGVPLLINDRVDVALAAGVEGVHIGQDDMGMFDQPVLLLL